MCLTDPSTSTLTYLVAALTRSTHTPSPFVTYLLTLIAVSALLTLDDVLISSSALCVSLSPLLYSTVSTAPSPCIMSSLNTLLGFWILSFIVATAAPWSSELRI
ncbi:hypothetical protein DFH08DRAFT_969283 [Mycena albidolilacea]|uniref:Uncharacterized protein n=1 Tax=Mycena albidolilacea TaxID=1033008 RepID=A0AAD6ZHF6_9AGAR|nr:hypothetical protein DFH08DRAFT_969283 [Mycena albidolilacea]